MTIQSAISPILALRAKIRSALIADQAFIGLLGGDRIYDETPATVETPYITFGEATARVWSSDDATGHDHTLSLNVWSRQGGDTEALAILNAMALVLDHVSPDLDGHRIVTMTIVEQAIGRPTKDGLRRAILRLTALTDITSF